LELVFVLAGELLGVGERGRLADGVDFDLVAVGVAEPGLDEGGGEGGDVDADPLPAELFRGVDGAFSENSPALQRWEPGP
jgi:hypothetical protein